MRNTTGCRILAAAATAISAVGLLTGPVPAQAAPCEQYGFPGEVKVTQGDPGYAVQTTFSSTGPTASGPASSKDTNGEASTGSISGVIKGRKVTLRYLADGAGSYGFFGNVDDDGIARGLVDPFDGSEIPWSTGGPLTCLDKAASPGTSADGRADVTGDVDMYDAPGGVGNKLPGFLAGGQRVELITCKDDNWCNVIAPDGKGVWVWGDFIEH